jgi:hypothetical protein
VRTEKFENREIEQVGAGRSELKKIAIGELAVQYTPAIHPKIELISSQENRRPGEHKQVQVEIKRHPGSKGE